MLNQDLQQSGFSLVEMAVVLLIIGLLLGGLIMPLTARVDTQRYQATESSLHDIREALIGYALVNDALPCPATSTSNGTAATAGGGCAVQHGFVPAVTLGLAGAQNNDGLLLDAYTSPIRYSVSNSDTDGDSNWDFTFPGEIRNVQIANVTPDLDVCTTATGSSATACAGAATTLTATAPAVVFSLGKDWATFTSADQQENVGATLGGYDVAADGVFVSRSLSSAAANEFDDIVTWVSPNSLYGRMVSAGRLP